MNRTLNSLLLAAFILSVNVLKAGPAEDIRGMTGKHTRMVWTESTGDGKDVNCVKPIHRLMGIDTDDGKGIRAIRATLGSYTKPLITPKGDRVVYTSYTTGKVHIVNWDGSGLRTLVTGYCGDVWMDPNTSIEYIYVRTKISATSAPIVRYQIDNTSNTLTIWNKTYVGNDAFGTWWQVSADGKRAAGTFPWSKAGIAVLPNVSWKQTSSGCWTSMAPDNSYYMWVFNNDHRTCNVYDGNAVKKGTLDLHTAPGISGWEIYHPRWTSDPNFITMNGPYDGNRGGSCSSHYCGNLITAGGTRMNIYLGKLDAARTRVTQWVRVTSNTKPEFFSDAWIGAAVQTPSMNVSPASLGFFAKPGGSNPASQNVTVTASGGHSLTGLTATGAGTWLSTSVSGSGDTRTITNSVNISGLAEGNYSKTITVKAGTITKTYTVNLTIATGWTEDFDGGKQQTWYTGSGTWSVVSNKLQNSGSGIMNTWAGDANWTDLTYTVEVTPQSAVDVWVLFRVKDASNYYLFTLNGGGGLWKVVNGSFTEIKKGSASFSTGTTYTIKVELTGSTIKIYNGTSLVLQATDTQFTKGYIGLGGNNATGAFDNIVVTSGSGTPVFGTHLMPGLADHALFANPNPVSDYIRINTDIPVSLYTCNGELIGTYINGNIYIGDLVPGVYVLKAGNQTRTILKLK